MQIAIDRTWNPPDKDTTAGKGGGCPIVLAALASPALVALAVWKVARR